MKTLDYDVAVIGGGPGGAWAGKSCAELGLRTLVVEKRQDIGSPVRCGEGMAKVWLDELGLKPSKEWIANEVEGARIMSPAGHTLTVNEKYAGNECGYVLNRKVFDQALAAEAARKGADFWVKAMATSIVKEGKRVTGVRVNHNGEEVMIRAPIVVGADGFESQVARWAGLNTALKIRDANACFQYNMVGVDCDVRYNDFFIGSYAPGGYIWVFPRSDDQANVGLGVNLSMLKNPGDTKMYLDKWIASQPGYAKGKVIEQVCGGISCSMPVKKSVTDGVMLVGDAARLIDPLTGGGIANAALSGMFVGPVAKEAHEHKDFSEKFLMKFDVAWRERLEDQLVRNYIAKEKLLDMSDETFDKIILALSTMKLEKITTYDILKAIESKYPELVAELAGLL